MSDKQYDNSNQAPIFDTTRAYPFRGEFGGRKCSGFVVKMVDPKEKMPTHKLALDYYEDGEVQILPLWQSKNSSTILNGRADENFMRFVVYINKPGTKVIANVKREEDTYAKDKAGGESVATKAVKDIFSEAEPVTAGKSQPDDDFDIPF